MGTTFSTYGKIPAYRLKNIIGNMNFSENKENKNPASNVNMQEYQDFLKFQEFKRMQDEADND